MTDDRATGPRRRHGHLHHHPLRFAVLLVGILATGCRPGDDRSNEEGRINESGHSTVWFRDEADLRGIDFVHDCGYRTEYLFPETACGGAALFDMDGDGDLDAYLVQAGPLLEPPGKRAPNQLFRNDDGKFTNVTDGSGSDDRGYGMGVAAGDYDNDGDVDLYVTNLGPNLLLQNDGRGHFSNVAAQAGVESDEYGSSCGFVDIDCDGDLDLYVANYLYWTPQNEQVCYSSKGVRTYGGPNLYSPVPDKLYRNDGDGSFTDVSLEAGIQDHFGNGLGLVFGDFNSDGWPDIFVANDMMPNQLWMNRKDGTFEDRAVLAGCAVAESGAAKAGMGVDAEDLDNDGDLDLIVVNLSSEPDSYFRNDGEFFVDRTPATGLSMYSSRHTRFGAGLVDFNNDTFFDFFIATGRINHDMPPVDRDTLAEPNLLYQGAAGPRFAPLDDPPAGIEPRTITTSRAAAFGDVDNDGRIDILMVNRNLQASLLMNVAKPAGHWIRFQVLDRHGRDALGAVVRLKVGDAWLRRDVKSCYSYCSANDPRVHVGLGEATSVDAVTVRWPTGEKEEFGPFPGDRQHMIRQAREDR